MNGELRFNLVIRQVSMPGFDDALRHINAGFQNRITLDQNIRLLDTPAGRLLGPRHNPSEHLQYPNIRHSSQLAHP